MNESAVITTTRAAGFAALINPESIEAAKDMAKMLATSGLVPEKFVGKPEAILVAGMMGHRLGLDVFSALAGIAVINGRPTLWGDTMLAVCQNHPEWQDLTEIIEGEPDHPCAVVTVQRKGKAPKVERFSFEDAERAGLAKKPGPWTQYPKRMMILRARSFALRGAFADVLAGFHSREEMEDTIDVTATSTVHADAPTPPAKARKVKAADPDTGKQTSAFEPQEATGKIHDPILDAPAGGAAQEQAKAEPPKAEEKPPTPVRTDATVEELVAQAKRIYADERKRHLLSGQMKRWNLAKIADLGGSPPEQRLEFFIELEKTEAEHDRMHPQKGGAK